MLDDKVDHSDSNPLRLDLPITDRAETSYTLSSSYYLDPEIYELEKQKIFYRTWQFISHNAALKQPGDYVTAQICDQNVFVIMGGDGELRAFYNVCRHRAHELLPGGSGNVKSVIVCPYHAWSYERDGALRGARFAADRPDFDRSKFGLRQIRLEMFLDCVFINLDDDAESLASQAGDLESDVRARVPYLSDLNVNNINDSALGGGIQQAGWKVVVDNYVECYHCEHAHPDFSSIICMGDYEVATSKLWSRQIGAKVRLKNSAYPLTGEEEQLQSMFWFLWPNTTFNIMPGEKEFGVFAIRPLAIDRCDFDGQMLSTRPSANEVRRAYTRDVLVPEDIALCESVQRGLHSMGYDQGPIIASDQTAGQDEVAIHHFHRLVYEALNESA